MNTGRKGRSIYIIVTTNISTVGGIQYYITGKTRYLESKGWDVYVFWGGLGKIRQCKIPLLNKYIKGCHCELLYLPCVFNYYFRNRFLKKLVRQIGTINFTDDIVVESHDDVTSLWGELIASRINGKHFIFLCNERYRGVDKHYEEYLDFFDFKLKRKEIAGEVNDAIQKLFGDYKKIQTKDVRIFLLDEDPVQDVQNDSVDILGRKEWNICYIGRASKGYVPNIIKGVSDFAHKYPYKSIQFVIVGNAEIRRELLEEAKSINKNLYVVELGDVVPIPRSIFKKIDVVIAGSGSARCSVYENVPTILADSETFLSNGLLGYDTKDFLYRSEQTIQDSFDHQLERVLVKEEYKSLNFDFIPKNNPSVCTEQNLELIRTSDSHNCYCSEEIICPIYKVKKRKIIYLYINNFLTSYFPTIKMMIKFFK